MTDIHEQLLSMCKSVAADLGGDLPIEKHREQGHIYVPEVIDNYTWNEDDFHWVDDEGNILSDDPDADGAEWLDDDGNVVDEDEFAAEYGGGYAYLQDCLDINYIVGSHGDLLGAEVVVGTGGPHIEIDTRRHVVAGYWGSDRVTVSYRDEIGLEDALDEMWEMTK